MLAGDGPCNRERMASRGARHTRTARGCARRPLAHAEKRRERASVQPKQSQRSRKAATWPSTPMAALGSLHPQPIGPAAQALRLACTRPTPTWRCRRRATSTRGAAKACRSGWCRRAPSPPPTPRQGRAVRADRRRRSIAIRPSTRCPTRSGICDDVQAPRHGDAIRASAASDSHSSDRCAASDSPTMRWCSATGCRNGRARAPMLEEDIALSNLALDLIGQARLFYASPARSKARAATRTSSPTSATRTRSATAARRAAERRLRRHDGAPAALRGVRASLFRRRCSNPSDTRLAEIAAKAVKEMAYHVRHAAEWVIRLGDGTEESQRAPQRRSTTLDVHGRAVRDGRWRARPGRGWASPPIARRSGRTGTGTIDRVLAEATLERPADAGCRPAAAPAATASTLATCSPRCSCSPAPIPE